MLVEDRGVRVPALGPRTEHERVRGERLADIAAIHNRACSLLPRTEEGVGRASQGRRALASELHERSPFVELDAEGLLAERGLPGVERSAAHGHVRERRRQVHDRVDVGIVQDGLERTRPGAEGPGELLGTFCGLIDARDELDELELGDGVRVRAADHPATDDRNPAHPFPRE